MWLARLTGGVMTPALRRQRQMHARALLTAVENTVALRWLQPQIDGWRHPSAYGARVRYDVNEACKIDRCVVRRRLAWPTLLYTVLYTLWSHHREETRQLCGERDDAGNNAGCPRARKTTTDNKKTWTWLPWKSQSEWRRTEMNGESTSMVWPALGSRTAKEQNREHQTRQDGPVCSLIHSVRMIEERLKRVQYCIRLGPNVIQPTPSHSFSWLHVTASIFMHLYIST